MPTLALTDLTVNALKPTEGQVKYFDKKLPAFGVRVGKKRKTFIVMMGRSRKLVTLGHYPDMPLADARQQAKKLLAGLPVEEFQSPSFPEILDQFLTKQAETLRPVSLYQITRTLRRHFKWQKRLDEITHSHVAEALDAIKAPSERAHALKDIRTFFNWCIPRYLKTSPCVGIKKLPQKSRDRVLTDDELRKVWVRARELGHPYGTIVQLLILTGQRSGEIAALQWEWIGDDTIAIPASVTKNGRATTIPTGRLAREIIAGVPRLGALLFPARGYTDKPFTGFGVSKLALDTCGVKGFTHHDLRRTFATNMAKLGVRLEVTEKLLNHVSGSLGGIVGVYQRHDFHAEMRAAVEKYEAWLLTTLLTSPKLPPLLVV
jgi:integrase